MKVYLVQFTTTDKVIFEPRIKNLGEWVKYYDDNYFVTSNLSAAEIYKHLTDGYENKSILVIQVSTTNYYGRMNTKVWDILKKNKLK
jgi:hypothetical protein